MIIKHTASSHSL